MPKFVDDNGQDTMNIIRQKEAEDLAQLLAEKYSLSYLDLSRVTIDNDALKLVPEAQARSAKMVVFQKTGQKIQVALQSPNLSPAQEIIAELERKGFSITKYIVSETSLSRAWKRYSETEEYAEANRGIVDVSPEKLIEFIKQAGTLEDLKQLFNSYVSVGKNRKISDLLEIILAGAIASDASDIHLEPQEKQVRLRLRLDGVLHDIVDFELKIYPLFLSRIKLVSGLKLNVHGQAQDGRFSIRLDDADVEVRTSIIPENYGESIVMRILNPKSIAVSFEQLGIEENLLRILEKEIAKPNGMILTTGPTGSGKTTTLYAFLKKVYSPEIKIVTLEDPIEYHLKGIIQTQVEKDYTFANGLRAILRQDPDVIMVGEIRDKETASIAINAALTGHLVLSTLHTNNAAGTIPRLIDLGINPNIIAPALNVSMAQRLIRKLCECKEQIEPTAEEKQTIEKILAEIPAKYKKPEKILIYKPVGCPKCNNLGYKGRIGIYEAILVDEKVEPLILKSPNETDIAKASEGQEILTMRQDGILKVLNGVTSMDELRRVVEL